MATHFLGCKWSPVPHVEPAEASVHKAKQLLPNGLWIVFERWANGVVSPDHAANQYARRHQISDQRFFGF